MDSSRRLFIRNIATISGVVVGAGCKSISKGGSLGGTELKVSPVDPSIPKRVPWTSLSAADKAAFIDTVLKMKRTIINVPASFGGGGARKLDRWAAQAESHQWYCDHGNWRFLPWHRAYLYYFELYLRKNIRDSFRLPYWPWDVNQEVPVELQDPKLLADLQITRQRNSVAVNSSGDLSKAWWQKIPDQIVGCIDFDTVGGDENSSGMSENPSHNRVHTGLGGNMGQVPFAAHDPAFWLHHCNVDRLWSVWMDKVIATGETRLLFPSTQVSDWLATSFFENYWGPDDKLASSDVRGALFTEKLGYNYDTMQKTWEFSDIPRDLEINESVSPVKAVKAKSKGLQLVETGSSDLNIDLSFPASLFSSSSQLRSLRLKVFGVPRPENSEITFQVTLVIGSEKLVLPEISFFKGEHTEHKDRAIGLNLTSLIKTIKALTANSNSGTLIFSAIERGGQPVNFQDVVKNFSENQADYTVKFKTVYK
ncbi:MAG: tyrosinase family protein [Proteobacteria bacterium]|nr:tyrosinase family protein [Pseudomonadota bacterium]